MVLMTALAGCYGSRRTNGDHYKNGKAISGFQHHNARLQQLNDWVATANLHTIKKALR